MNAFRHKWQLVNIIKLHPGMGVVNLITAFLEKVGLMAFEFHQISECSVSCLFRGLFS